MTGDLGKITFLGLLFLAVVFFVMGMPEFGLLCLIGDAAVFAFWRVDTGDDRR